MGVPDGTKSKDSTCQCRDGRDELRFPGREVSPEQETATHASVLAWKIPWTEEPEGLQSRRSGRVSKESDTAEQLSNAKGGYELIRKYGICICNHGSQDKVILDLERPHKRKERQV